MMQLLLYVIAGHTFAYWSYRLSKMIRPLLQGARMLWALRARPLPPLGGQLDPSSFAGLTAHIARTDLSKFTTESAHQSAETPLAAPPTPLGSVPSGSVPSGPTAHLG